MWCFYLVKVCFDLSLALDFYVLLFYFVLLTFFLQNTLVICFLVANQIINIYGSCWQILLQCRWPTMSKKLTLIGLISVSVKSVPNEFFWPKIFLEFVFFFKFIYVFSLFFCCWIFEFFTRISWWCMLSSTFCPVSLFIFFISM